MLNRVRAYCKEMAAVETFHTSQINGRSAVSARPSFAALFSTAGSMVPAIRPKHAPPCPKVDLYSRRYVPTRRPDSGGCGGLIGFVGRVCQVVVAKRLGGFSSESEEIVTNSFDSVENGFGHVRVGICESARAKYSPRKGLQSLRVNPRKKKEKIKKVLETPSQRITTVGWGMVLDSPALPPSLAIAIRGSPGKAVQEMTVLLRFQTEASDLVRLMREYNISIEIG